jgi:hypothetical protein
MPEPGALVLIALTALFFARVLGQALVAFAGVSWLPPMEAWYSGLLPYPVLLPVQVLILLLQVKLDIDVVRATGLLARPRPGLGHVLRAVGCAYAGAMIVRYAVTHGHAIPVVFHLVLAAYLLALGRLAPGERPGVRVPRTGLAVEPALPEGPSAPSRIPCDRPHRGLDGRL